MTIRQHRTLGFMVHIKQQISSFSAVLLVRMIQQPWFQNIWAQPYMKIPTDPQSTHSLTSYLYAWKRNIISLTASPQRNIFTWEPHNNIFWPKILPNHLFRFHPNFLREIYLTTQDETHSTPPAICHRNTSAKCLENPTQINPFQTSSQPPILPPPPTILPL